MENIKEAGEGVRVEDVRAEWKQLWCSRFDDKVKAEGVANQLFPLLFVERGTVIAATRDFKPLDLKEILKAYKFDNTDRLIDPHPSVGGAAKFARTVLNKQNRFRRLPNSEPGSSRVARAGLSLYYLLEEKYSSIL